ncbi:putative ABC transporter permease [Lacticaseibacillus zhaodongensis]|uniref:putative ABC transporter permease n=1 Tax=Lacticaseibacillus zhaodongensis TaxID=2668065 RepID=UPI0012D2B632|nr:putative ABC transporter permease [Lacticaseibacillus zhaodongensis]
MNYTQQLIALEQQFTIWALYFFAYGFIGWIWESGYVSVRKKRWVNSGFLNGPIIPVYGFSIVAVLAAVRPFAHNLILLYLISAVVISIIEYVTSWGMEKLFHARWWDYSKVPLNINGRIAIPISAFWGLGVVFIVNCVHPFVARVVTHLDLRYGMFAVVAIMALFMFDVGFTLANALALGAATKRIGDAIAAKKAELAARVDLREQEWLEDYKDGKRGSKLPHLSYVQRRLLQSFPNLQLRDTPTEVKDIRDLVALLRQQQKAKHKQ